MSRELQDPRLVSINSTSEEVLRRKRQLVWSGNRVSINSTSEEVLSRCDEVSRKLQDPFPLIQLQKKF